MAVHTDRLPYVLLMLASLILLVVSMFGYFVMQQKGAIDVKNNPSEKSDWISRTQTNSRNSVLFANQKNPKETRLIATGATLLYQSRTGSGTYDSYIDMTPLPAKKAQFDGWEITKADWNFRLGRISGKGDGWVGYGSQQGGSWFLYRLAAVGFFDPLTHTWVAAGGAPSYNRDNLSIQTDNFALPDGNAVVSESVLTWQKLWSINDGAVSFRFKARGDGVKDEVIMDQHIRDWLESESDDTPAVGFRFEVDWGDVKTIKQGEKTIDTTKPFSDNGEALELYDANEELIGVLPLDYAIVPRMQKNEEDDIRILTKYFYNENNKTYMVLALSSADFTSLRDGDLIFDPTINAQVGASANDAIEHSSTVGANRTWTGGGTASINSATLSFGRHSTGNGDNYSMGARFTGVSIAQGTTITSASFILTPSITYNAGANPIRAHVSGQNADNAAVFTSSTQMLNATNRPRTTADCGIWVQTSVTVDVEESVDVTSCVQEIINRAGWGSGNAIAILLDTYSTSSDSEWQDYYSYDSSTSKAPKLDITYTVAGDSPPHVKGGSKIKGGIRL